MISIAGFVPFTTIDFPGRLASVIFMSGCPLRCPFCHNPGLQGRGAGAGPSWEEIVLFVVRRRGTLEGGVLSGGVALLSAAGTG